MDVTESHNIAKNTLKDFHRELQNNWKVWVVKQIKLAMIRGESHITLSRLRNKDWKKGRTFGKNLLKKNPVSVENQKYYDKNTNVLLVNKTIRKMVDFVHDLEMKWSPRSSSSFGDEFKISYDEIIAHWDRNYSSSISAT